LKKLIYILLCIAGATQLNAQKPGKPVYTRQVYFEFNKYDIRPADTKTFTAFLRAIKAQNTGYTITLTGHTDNIDNDQYNQKLGLNRAKAVKDFLVKKGVAAEAIKIESKGEKVAIKENTTDTGRALNRRVEMALYGGTGPAPSPDKPETRPDGGIWLTGLVYDADTKEQIKGDVIVTIKNPREVDRDKIKQHKQTDNYGQSVIKDRTYSVYVTSEGYRAENYEITVAADTKESTIIQHLYLKKLVIKRRFNYEKIYFVPDKDEFQPTAHDELEKLLRFMEHDTTTQIEIRGHINYTKNRPPMSDFEQFIFQNLSLRRAIAVYNFLVRNGTNPARMSYRGMSNTEMVLPYARTLEESQRNMRVEILVLK
jgi:outer membrane protein OmpA-like peptidoglycan-associated protein